MCSAHTLSRIAVHGAPECPSQLPPVASVASPACPAVAMPMFAGLANFSVEEVELDPPFRRAAAKGPPPTNDLNAPGASPVFPVAPVPSGAGLAMPGVGAVAAAAMASVGARAPTLVEECAAEITSAAERTGWHLSPRASHPRGRPADRVAGRVSEASLRGRGRWLARLPAAQAAHHRRHSWQHRRRDYSGAAHVKHRGGVGDMGVHAVRRPPLPALRLWRRP